VELSFNADITLVGGSERGQIMNTLDATAGTVQTSSALSPTGDLAGMNLGADSETLALFASLFAMIQTPKSDDAASVQDGLEEMPPAIADPAGRTPLPAAAMLMAARGLGSGAAPELPHSDIAGARDMTSETAVDGDAANLVRLLLTARDIAMPDRIVAEGAAPDKVASVQVGSDQDAVPSGTGKTATEMLTGAIEILRSLETVGAVEDVVADMAEMTRIPSMQGQVVMNSSPDFVGPMPVVTTPTLAAASAAFVGPMPAAGVPTAELAGPPPAVTMPTLAAASPEFVGPMPAAVMANTAPSPAGMVQPVPANIPANIPGSEPGQRQSAGLSSSMAIAAAEFESAEGELHPADMVAVRKDGRAMTGGRDLIGKDADGQLGKGSRQMAETQAQTSRSAAVTLKQSTMQGAAQILSQMHAKQTPHAPQPAATASASTTADVSGQSNAGQTGGHSGGQTGGQTGGQSGGQSGGQAGTQHMVDAGSARGTGDRTMLHRLNTETAGWSEAMVKRLSSDLQAGVRNVRMILEPRHLGRLNVELGLRNGRASIRIAAETAEAARLLSTARGQLGQMLENAGLRLAGFQASGTGGDAAFEGGQGSNAHAGQDGGKNAGRNQDFSNKMTSQDADPRESEMASDGVDDTLRAGETAVLSILA